MVAGRRVDEADPVVCEDEVAIGRRHVDVRGLERLPVGGLRDGQRRPAREHVREQAAVSREQVEDDDDGGVDVGRQLLEHVAERERAARRCAEHDDPLRRVHHAASISHASGTRTAPGRARERVDRDGIEERQQQAEIHGEQAASRALEAEQEHRRIAEARAAVASGDPERITQAAVDLHRAHALHEAKAGHIERSRASLVRAANAGRRLARLRRG